MTAKSELHRLAARTILVAFEGTTAPPWLRTALERDGYAGVTLFGSNIESDAQTAALTSQLTEWSPDVIVGIDEEGGDVTRLGYASGSPYPGNAALGRVNDVALTRQVYAAMGADLSALGVTVNFAPSADINTAPDNPVIGTRSFGADPNVVTRHTVAALEGLQGAGVAACVKHFPGHGATNVDSHVDVPVVDVPLEVLHGRELAPFVAAVRCGVAGVMTGHVRVPALTGDDVATTSRRALIDLLRNEIGFDGVIVTDSLEMAAIRRTLGMAEGAALALAAGADLLCTGGELRGQGAVEPLVEGVARAVRDGRLTEDRLFEAGNRAAAFRRRSQSGAVESHANGQVGLAAARRAVALMAGAFRPITRPLVVELQSEPGLAVGAVPWGLAGALSALMPGTERRAVTEAGADPQALAAARDRSLVVVIRDAHRYRWQHRFVDQITRLRDDVIVVEMGLPVWRPERASAYIATYGAGRSNAHAAAELLAGARGSG